MKLGFIGLGRLGFAMAVNLKEAGHDLYVYNRTVSKTSPLAEKGAFVCSSVAELAKSCTVVFSIVSDDAALTSVCEGENGLLKNLSAGSIHISMSTVLPKTAADLADAHTKAQLHYLAAPVFGRPEAAAAKKLNYVVCGQEAVRKQAEPLLRDTGAAGIFDFGSNITAANTVKLCGNFLIASAIEAIGESTSLAEKSGVDTAAMWNMLLQTLFNAPLYHTYSKIVLEKKYTPPSFTAKLGLKDMKLVNEQARIVNQQMPLGDMLQTHMSTLVNRAQEELDWSAVWMGGQNEQNLFN